MLINWIRLDLLVKSIILPIKNIIYDVCKYYFNFLITINATQQQKTEQFSKRKSKTVLF